MGKRKDQKLKRMGRTSGGGNQRRFSDQSNQHLRPGRYAVWTTGVLLSVVAVVGAWMVLRDGAPATLSASTLAPSVTVLAADTAKAISSDSVSGSPTISFPEKEHDFGTIAQGLKASHTFIVQNLGDAPLRLIRAAGS